MKKLFYLFLCCFAAMTFVVAEAFSAETTEIPVKGVNLAKASFGGPKAQLRIDDSILESNGSVSKEFTMSVHVWIDKVSEGELSFSNIPLFGINMTNFYGITTMADVVLDNGAYNVKANKNAASTAIAGDKHNPVNARMEEWVWLTLVVNDEEGWAKLYCDGEESSNLDYSSNGKIFRDGEEAVFHCTNGMSYSSLSLRFDDLKIVPKALTAEEIADLYYAYKEGEVPENIKAYYTFDETTGTVNEYPDMTGGNIVAQVVEGTTDYSGGSYSPKLSATDAMCDGWTPVYRDKETFTVNVTVEGEGSVVIKDYDGNEYQSGSAFMKDSTVFITTVPADDHILSEVYIDNVRQTELENISFKVTKNTEVKVIFTLKGALVNIADENIVGGTYTCVDPSTETEYPKDATGKYYSIPYNSKVMIKATADEGYKLKSISIVYDGNTQELEIGNPVFTVESDIYEIQTVFVARYSLNFRVDGEGGSISVKANGQSATAGKLYDAGTEIEITVTPDKEKELSELTVNGTPVETTNGVYTMTLESNTDIVATFTDITGIDSQTETDVYYDSLNRILYAKETSVIKVYSLSGSLVREITGKTINMNEIEASECIVTIVNNGKTVSLKIIK